MTGLLDLDSSRGDSLNVRLGAPSLAALVRGVTAAAGSASSAEALRALAEVAQAVSGAEIALVRALDDSGERLEAVAVAAPRALAAELYGTVLSLAELPEAPLAFPDLGLHPNALRNLIRHNTDEFHLRFGSRDHRKKSAEPVALRFAACLDCNLDRRADLTFLENAF